MKTLLFFLGFTYGYAESLFLQTLRLNPVYKAPSEWSDFSEESRRFGGFSALLSRENTKDSLIKRLKQTLHRPSSQEQVLSQSRFLDILLKHEIHLPRISDVVGERQHEELLEVAAALVVLTAQPGEDQLVALESRYVWLFRNFNQPKTTGMFSIEAKLCYKTPTYENRNSFAVHQNLLHPTAGRSCSRAGS